MASTSTFLATLQTRRTIYALKKENPITDARVQEIVRECVLHVPSSFNSQTTRVVLLVKGEHDKLWEFVKEILKAKVSAEQWKITEGRLDMFAGGYGTILFFEAQNKIKQFQEKFAIYADKFPTWATQSDAMTQYAIWTALEAEGLGANLQHYNPLIDAKVKQEWKIPEDWTLNAQLVFGGIANKAGEKTFENVDGERFLSFGV